MNAQSSGSPTISPAYQKEQELLHESGTYGRVSITYAPMVSQIIDRMEVGHLLDYGCGAQTNLAKHLKVNRKLVYQAYDPAVPKFSKPPVPAQMVACIDVLEHIEPEYLATVLDHLAQLTEVILFATVTTCAAKKVLSDGRNAHLTQEPMSWWLPHFWTRWDIQTVQTISEHSFFVVGLTKPRLEGTDGKLL